MKVKCLSVLAASLLFIQSASANLIPNGDFESCDGSNWITQADATDAGSPYFDFADDGSNCSVDMTVDDTVFGLSLVSEILDFSGDVGDIFTLSFDYIFSGDSLFIDDNDIFEIGFESSGILTPLFELSTYGASSVSIQLDSSFLNQTGLRFRVDLIDTFGFDPVISTLNLDNIMLTRTSAPVSTPIIFSLFLGSLFVLLMRRKISFDSLNA